MIREKKIVMKKVNVKTEIFETIKSIAVAFLIYLFISTTIVEGTEICSGSMENTLLVGDRVYMNKFIYGIKIPYTDIRLPALKEPEPGDIVVFKYPLDESMNYVKRCIAVAGQTVEIRNKVVYVDGKPLQNPEGAKFTSSVFPNEYIESDIFPRGSGNRDNYGPIKVPDGHLFVMGDNRDNSYNSRYWGFMPVENIIGKAIIILWSYKKDVPLWDIPSKIRWSRICNIPE